MRYSIRMGIPEMKRLWDDLQSKFKSGTINKQEAQLYKKWGKALKLLSENPLYPSLRSHEISQLTGRYGIISTEIIPRRFGVRTK